MYIANYQDQFWKEIGKELKILSNKPESSVLKIVADVKPPSNGLHSPLSPEILSMTTHDMLTPLSAISGNLKLLNKCLESDQNIEKIGEYSSVIGTGVNDLLDLLTQLRDIALAESNRAELDLTEIDISRLLFDMKPLFDSLVRDKQQKIVLEVQETGKLFALIDVVKFKRVIYNLFSNAVKYTGEGGHIRITARKDDGKICISMSDTGAGISESELDEIFKPFTRVSKTNHPGNGSMGLGLYISTYFCMMMGGDITVESRLGMGSVFTVSLPEAD